MPLAGRQEDAMQTTLVQSSLDGQGPYGIDICPLRPTD